MLMFLSKYEPTNVVSSQDGVEREPSDEEDGEDQEPVDALYCGARERSQVVCICHIFIGIHFKP